ncbi:MAG: RluA family pseudouridine synthase [Planctomycetes bacterium]|nr:RluA family pseudouridine synthase [Planctomycetota bacterium]
MDPQRRPDGPTPQEILLRSRIGPQADGMALLDHLLRRFPYHDRAGWLRELAAGRLTIDGIAASPDQRLRRGTVLAYRKLHVEPAVSRDVRVVHRAADWAVVEKPAHLPVHADGPFVRNTLVHLLRSGPLPLARLVHRLDRETSGLCVVACSPTARASLDRQFAAGTVAKAYLAVVRGEVPGDFRVDAPIGRARGSDLALRRSAAAQAIEAQPACTDFVVAERGAGATLLRCVPHHGRTHQIRVHLEHAGFPLLGDKLYGRPDADYLAFVARVKAGGDAREAPPGEPGRQLLHAAELAFDAPDTNHRVRFVSPAPPEFAAWLHRTAQPGD